MPEAKAALAEAMKLNPKLSVAWFHERTTFFNRLAARFPRSPHQGGAPRGVNAAPASRLREPDSWRRRDAQLNGQSPTRTSTVTVGDVGFTSEPVKLIEF
jgi:hypothetical protein